VTNGAMGAIYSAVTNLTEPGDEVILFEPYFTYYVNCIEFAGCQLKTSKMSYSDDKWHFDLEQLSKTISPKTKLLLITNPHNPTGKMFTQDEIA
jgi:aspartate/methionine/tyrosine aminotransferase